MKKVSSLKKRMFFLLAAYVTAAIAVLSLIAVTMYRNTIDNSRKNISVSLDSASNLISGSLRNVSFTNSVIIENPDLINLLSSYSEKDYISQFYADISLNEILNTAWRNNAEIAEIKLFVAEKKYSSGSGAIQDLSYITNSSWYNELQGSAMLLKTKNPADNLTNKERAPSGTSISMCSKIMSDDNALAYLRIDISKEHLDNIMRSVLHSSESKVFLLDSEGQIIIGDTDSFSENNLQKLSAIKAAASGGIVTLDGNLHGYMGQYSSLNAHGMRILELIPKNDILKPYYKSITVIFTAAILILLCISVLSCWLILIISKRIYKFSSAAGDGYAETVPFEELSPLKTVSENISELNQKNRLYNISFTSSRINPHFLYNALESIVWNLDELNKDQIAHTLSSLSHFYRLMLLSASFVCRLNKEIQLISRYLELQKECFGSQISSSVDIADELLDLYIPSFILQPLVENSFKHGFSNKTHNLHISVKANIISDKLVIILMDNGCGMDNYTLEKINNSSDLDTDALSLHEGIRNIRQRIDMLCSGDYSMEFSSSLTGGTTVKISLPVTKDPNFYNINLKEFGGKN